MSTVDPAKSDPVEPGESQSTLDEEENREPETSVNEEIPSTGRIRFMNWPYADSETSQVNTNRNTASWFRRDTHQENRIKAPSAEMVSVNSTVLGNPEKDTKSAPPAASNKFTWFHKEKKQDDLNFAAMKDLDERAKKNVQAPNRPWWIFRDQNSAVVDPNMNLNTTYRSYRESNGLDENAATTTAIVRRSNARNILWNALSRSFQQNSIWRAATKANKQTDETSNTRVGAAALLIHAIQRPFQRRKQQANDNDGTSENAETTSAPRTRRWGFFARSWSQKNDEELGASSIEEPTSTAIVPFDPASHPIAVAMRKATVGLGGTCMVVVGVPLLLLPVPGPGIALIASGVYVISTEFQFARHWLEGIKSRYGNIFDRIGIEVGDGETMPLSNIESDTSEGTSSPVPLPASPGSVGADESPIPAADDETGNANAKNNETVHVETEYEVEAATESEQSKAEEPVVT